MRRQIGLCISILSVVYTRFRCWSNHKYSTDFGIFWLMFQWITFSSSTLTQKNLDDFAMHCILINFIICFLLHLSMVLEKMWETTKNITTHFLYAILEKCNNTILVKHMQFYKPPNLFSLFKAVFSIKILYICRLFLQLRSTFRNWNIDAAYVKTWPYCIHAIRCSSSIAIAMR